ncbi:hypothetical protein GIX45_10330 [Erwinia sp. CPCC 100877]|nr:hypothetical protein [Erwinia sp. CPCC 100877]
MNSERQPLLFIKKFLSKVTFTTIELFDSTGKNFENSEIDDTIQMRTITEIVEQEHKLFIPITIHENEHLILRILLNSSDELPYLRAFAASLKNMLESSLAYAQDNNTNNLDMLDDLLTELLLRDSFDPSDNLIERTNLLHFDYTVKRRIILVDIIHFKQLVHQSSVKTQVQEQLNKVQSILKSHINSFSEYAHYLYDDKFVLFKNDHQLLEQQLLAIRKQIQDELALSVQFIVSHTCRLLEDYRIEFKKITELQKRRDYKQLHVPILAVDDYQIELLLANINDEDKQFFMPKNGIDLRTLYEKNEELVTTFIQYFKQNMDTRQTAAKLFIHKNTVYYRIKKLSEMLQTDLFLSYNCTLLFLQLCLLQEAH